MTTAADSVFNHSPFEYDGWFDNNPDMYEYERALLHTAIPGAGTGFEVGFGSGKFASPLGIRHGLDPSLPLLALARRRGINAVQGCGEALPYRSGTFDFVLIMTGICFLDALDRSLREAFRVIRPGGDC